MKKSDIHYPLLLPAAGLLTVFICLRYGSALTEILFPGRRGLWPGVLIRLPALILLCLFLHMLTGARVPAFAGRNAASVWKHSLPLLLMMFLLSSAGAVQYITNGGCVTPDRLARLPSAAVFCTLVGLTEEIAFRALLYEGFRSQLRDKRRAYRYSAVLTFLLFGAAHIIGFLSAPLSGDPLFFIALLLRFTETGLFGLIMLCLYAGSGSITACSAVHAVFDFTALLPALLFSENVNTARTLRYNPVSVILLAAVCAFLLILLLRLHRVTASEIRT